MQKTSQEPVSLEVDHPSPSPEPPVETFLPSHSPSYNSHLATSSRKRQISDTESWASPAFLRNNFTVTQSYDPFAEDVFRDNDRQKRIKFGRGSGQWRFAERTPSPEHEPFNMRLDTNSPLGLPNDQLRPNDVAEPKSVDAHEFETCLPILEERRQQQAQAEDDLSLRKSPTGQEHAIKLGNLDESNGQEAQTINSEEELTAGGVNASKLPLASAPVSKIEEPKTLFPEEKGSTSTSAESTASSSSIPSQSKRGSGVAGDGEDSDVQYDIDDEDDAAFNVTTSDFGLDGATFSRIKAQPAEVSTAIEEAAEGTVETEHQDRINKEVQPISDQQPKALAGSTATQAQSKQEAIDSNEIKEVPDQPKHIPDQQSNAAHDSIATRAELMQQVIKTEELTGTPDERLASFCKESNRRIDDTLSPTSNRDSNLEDEGLDLNSSELSQNSGVLDSGEPAQQRSVLPLASSDQLESQESQDSFATEKLNSQNMSNDVDAPVFAWREQMSSEEISQEKPDLNMQLDNNDLSMEVEPSTIDEPQLGRLQDSGMSGEETGIKERTVEIVHLESESEEDTMQTVPQRVPLPAGTTNSGEITDSEINHPLSFQKVSFLDATPVNTNIMAEDRENQTDSSRTDSGTDTRPNIYPSSLSSVLASKDHLLQSVEEGSAAQHEAKLPSSKVTHVRDTPPKEMVSPEPTPIEELPATVPDSIVEKSSTSQLLTPNATQRKISRSQPSSVFFQAASEGDTSTTPRLSQRTSGSIANPPTPSLSEAVSMIEEEHPVAGQKPTLIERLKAIRSASSKNPRARSSDASAVSPWFAPKALNHAIPDSQVESEVRSSSESDQETVLPTISASKSTPEKLLAKSFIRSPPQAKSDIHSLASSLHHVPSSQSPHPGFRTSLSYFVPLASLASHFANSADILAIAISTTPVTRASSGPKDFNQTIYITDPSSISFQPLLTTVQIFRPNKHVFPLIEEGDALLLRDFKVQSFQKRISLLSTDSSSWAIFRKGADVQVRGPPVEFGAEERGFAKGLWDWWGSRSEREKKALNGAIPKNRKESKHSQDSDLQKNGGISIYGVPEFRKLERTMNSNPKRRSGKHSSQTPSPQEAKAKKEYIEGMGIQLPGSQPKARATKTERSLTLDGTVDATSSPRRVLRPKGNRNKTPRHSESTMKVVKHELRDGTVYSDQAEEPKTQNGLHELRDGRTYRDTRE